MFFSFSKPLYRFHLITSLQRSVSLQVSYRFNGSIKAVFTIDFVANIVVNNFKARNGNSVRKDRGIDNARPVSNVLRSHIWWRFIDDIFMIWTHSLDDLQTFTTYLNNIHPTIKFTSNHSFTSIPFLDVSVSLCNGTITTDLYTKPTDKHQYLLQSSCHPKHTKRAIPFSLALRLRRICSSDDTFTLRTNELKTYLNKRGYNLSFLNQEIGRVNDITRSDALTNKDTPDTDQPTRVPLVITYNPALRPVSSIIHKHFNILSSSPRCANVFKATPLVAFRRTNNLSNLLVSAKLPNPTHNTPPHGSFLCGDNCLTCNYITDGRTSYTFHSTGETRLITHHIDCNSKNVIYMVHCNRCHKQYIGETK